MFFESVAKCLVKFCKVFHFTHTPIKGAVREFGIVPRSGIHVSPDFVSFSLQVGQGALLEGVESVPANFYALEAILVVFMYIYVYKNTPDTTLLGHQ